MHFNIENNQEEGLYTMTFNDCSLGDSGDMEFTMHQFHKGELIKKFYKETQSYNVGVEHNYVNNGSFYYITFDKNRKLSIKFIQKVDDEILSEIEVTVDEEYYSEFM